jgi:NADPH:quinone reductase-like Zn-dependent oxidoreductase
MPASTTPAEHHNAITQHEVGSTAKIVRFHELGGPEVLQIEELPLPEPGPGEVRLRVKAIGLNRAEVAFRAGKYLVTPELPSKLGYEASGIVEAIGIGVSQTWLGKIASTVPAFPADKYGVYGEVAIVPASALAEYPQTLSPEEGTSIWMQYLTAWGALCHFGKLAKGDYVLIPAASSSVGLAAIEICNAEGAVPIALTRTQVKKQELLALGAAHVVVTETEDIVERVKEITGGKLARLVFDPVGGATFAKLAEATAPQGTLFLYGMLGRGETPLPVGPVLSKHLTVRGYTLFEITGFPESAKLREQGEDYIRKGLISGVFKPKIAKTFPLDQIVEAHRYMQSNEQVGKIVVTV